jgi:hypothetical protein
MHHRRRRREVHTMAALAGGQAESEREVSFSRATVAQTAARSPDAAETHNAPTPAPWPCSTMGWPGTRSIGKSKSRVRHERGSCGGSSGAFFPEEKSDHPRGRVVAVRAKRGEHAESRYLPLRVLISETPSALVVAPISFFCPCGRGADHVRSLALRSPPKGEVWGVAFAPAPEWQRWLPRFAGERAEQTAQLNIRTHS